MDALRQILVLMEPSQEAQPAFVAALQIAERFGARLHLFMSDYRELNAAFFDMPTQVMADYQESLLRAHREVLDRHVQRAAAAGITATAAAVWGSPFHELALESIQTLRPDLVVKHSVHHHRIERTIFTGSDWHLMRECPVPLLLVKDPTRLSQPRTLVCVDPQHLHDKPASLDRQLLRTAVMLRERLGGEVHALHVFALPHPVAVIGDAYIAAAATIPDETTLATANQAVRELLSAFPAVTPNARLRVGIPSQEIVAEAGALEADLVIMGTISRSRLERWFIGNTAEATLDRLPCNVLIEKPRPR